MGVDVPSRTSFLGGVSSYISMGLLKYVLRSLFFVYFKLVVRGSIWGGLKLLSFAGVSFNSLCLNNALVFYEMCGIDRRQ